MLREQLTGYWKKFGKELDVVVDVLPATPGSQGLNTELVNRQMIVNDWMMERINNDTQSMIVWVSKYCRGDGRCRKSLFGVDRSRVNEVSKAFQSLEFGHFHGFVSSTALLSVLAVVFGTNF